jgi:hypothetical protein
MLEQATLGFKKIVKDVDNFSIDGMIEPTFYNFSNEDVIILHTVVKPGEKFLAGVTGLVMKGSVSIHFTGTGAKKLMLYYGDPVTDC